MPRKKPNRSSVRCRINGQTSEGDTEHLDLMFISINNGDKPRNEHQQRSHVMQNYFKRMSAAHATSLSKPKQATTLAGSKMSFRQGPDGLQQRHPYWYGKKSSDRHSSQLNLHDTKTSSRVQTPSLTRRPRDEEVPMDASKLLFHLSTSPLLLFGTRGFDTFGVLPVHLSRSDEVLLDMFSRADKWPWCPIHSQAVWQPFALSDALVLHVTLYAWSWSFRVRLDPLAEAFTPDLIRHKVSSLSLINARLSDPVQAIEDETIAAVAAITTMEVMLGTKEEATKHMNGLRMLLAMRGGFSTFASAMQLLILRLIMWTDLIYSELHELPLSFPAAKVYEEAWESPEKYQLDSHLGISDVELRAAGSPHHEVIELLHDTHLLCHAEQIDPLRSQSESERMKRGDMFHSVERRLWVFLNATPSRSSDTWDHTFWRAVALANLIFVHHSLRGNSPGHAQFRKLIPQLQQSLLRMSEHSNHLIFAPALLLWILGVGVIASPATSLQPWFITQLSDACKHYPVHSSWHKFHGLLSRFLWTGEADEQRYRGIWQMLETQV